MEQCCLRAALTALLAFWFVSSSAAQTPPKLLLTPQRLRRLMRDRQRQTLRWSNFENRIQTASDSPERGFELALFYAITRDDERGREAVEWALAHPCDRRQVALVLDWCADLLSEAQRQQLANTACNTGPPLNLASEIRNKFFLSVAKGEDFRPDRSKDLLASLQAGNFEDAEALYAACEYLSAVRTTDHLDLREDARQFFSTLPIEMLLSLKPAAVERPNWKTHIAALALVSLDPNLEGSQYLQAWAMQPSETLREGPGVAYEFLWADPYLPGVAYENLDPWVYDSTGRLFARADWTPDACWVAISTRGVAEENCRPGWRRQPATFGRMILIPMTGPCMDLPRLDPKQTAILWQLPPHQTMLYGPGKQQSSVQADAAGLLRLTSDMQGKVCRSR